MKLFNRFFLALVAVGTLLIGSSALAQPALTNVTPQFGTYLPNQNFVPATQPAQTLANQYALGINTGSSSTPFGGAGTVTNSFSTNYVYTYAPVVTANQTGLVLTTTNAIVSVTTTNFIYNAGTTNVSFNWTAIGR